VNISTSDLFAFGEFARFDPTEFALYLNWDKITERADKELSRLAFEFFFAPMMTSLLAPYGESYLASCNEEQLQFALQAFTLYTHEVRHYHDLILLPYGSFLKRQSLKIQLEYAFWDVEVMLSNKVLYIPYSEWVANTNFLTSVYPDLALPSIGVHRLAETFEEVFAKLQRFNTAGIETDELAQIIPTGTSMLESLAILIQENDIARRFGEVRADSFRANIFRNQPGKEYYKALVFIYTMFDPFLLDEVVIYLLLAGLSGNFQDQRSSIPRYPSDLLPEIIYWIHKKPQKTQALRDFEACTHIINEYFREQHGSTFYFQLKQGLEANRTMLQHWREYEKKKGDHLGRHYSDLILEEYELFCETQAQVIQKFIDDPYSYCSPRHYLQTQLLDVQPLIYLQSEGGIPLAPEWLSDHRVNVHTGTRINISDVPLNLRNQFPPPVEDGNIDFAHVVSTRFHDSSIKTSEQQAEIWRGTLHDFLSHARIELEGANCGFPSMAINHFLSALNLTGRKVYTGIEHLLDRSVTLSLDDIEQYARQRGATEQILQRIQELRKQQRD
jgi:hypothetical protein